MISTDARPGHLRHSLGAWTGRTCRELGLRYEVWVSSKEMKRGPRRPARESGYGWNVLYFFAASDLGWAKSDLEKVKWNPYPDSLALTLVPT